MAVMELGSFTATPTGNNVLNLNGTETPTLIEFWVGPRNGTIETVNMSSFGVVDITNGIATWQSNYTDATGSQTKNGSGSSTTSSCLQHWNRVSGTLTKIIDVKFVSATSGSFTVNIVTNNASYIIYCKIFG